MARQTKRFAEEECRCDKKLLIPATTRTGEKCYLRTDRRESMRLWPMYHADGRAMVEWSFTYWRQLVLHPNNAITVGRFATPAEIAARECADKAALQNLLKEG